MAVWARNVKMTDPLVAAAELSEENCPGKYSREVWDHLRTISQAPHFFDMIFDNILSYFLCVIIYPFTYYFLK